MTPLEPIFITDLFYKLDEKLIEVLKSLSPDDWERPTIAPLWKVKDIAAHLLDTNIRALSTARDGYTGEPPTGIHSYQDLINFLNQLNAGWVNAFKRVSPQVLTEMLENTGRPYCDYISNVNPFDKAIYSVAWAGEQESANWFHVAREYTEKWHHQQQIRLAVGKDAELYTREFYYPHLETSMRALPHHYRNVAGKEGDMMLFIITGEGGGQWNLYHTGTTWQLVQETTTTPVAIITIDGTVAWRLFTRGISKSEAGSYVKIEGNAEVGSKIFDMLAVMA